MTLVVTTGVSSSLRSMSLSCASSSKGEYMIGVRVYLLEHKLDFQNQSARRGTICLRQQWIIVRQHNGPVGFPSCGLGADLSRRSDELAIVKSSSLDCGSDPLLYGVMADLVELN